MNKLKYSVPIRRFGEEAFREPERSFDRLIRLGFQGAEITPDPTLPPENLGYAENLKKILRNYQLEIPVILDPWGAAADPVRPFKDVTDPQMREHTIRYIKRRVDFARVVGAKAVAVSITPYKEVKDPLEARKSTIDCLQESARYAKEKGIYLYLEPINRLEAGRFMNTLEAYLELLEEVGVENIRILADTFHMNIEENSIVESLWRVGDKLSHLHFRDSNSLVPGFGHIDFKSIIRILKDIDFSGFCSIESDLFIPNVESCLRLALAYLKSLEEIVETQLLR